MENRNAQSGETCFKVNKASVFLFFQTQVTDDNQTKNLATIWPFAQNLFIKSTYSPGKYLIKPFNLKITDGITGRPMRALTLA